MPKIYDIRPPRHSSGINPDADIPAPKVAKDLSSLEVQSHDWHLPGVEKVEQETAEPVVQEVVAEEVVPAKPEKKLSLPGRELGKKAVAASKTGVTYLVVGLASFLFFSLLFYGFNQYQERQRQALEENTSGVAGEQITLQTSGQPSIRILNASSSSERLESLKAALEAANLEARSVGTASQLSSPTIIYYKTSAQEQAVQLGQTLAPFNPSLEKNDDIAGVNDIVILLGSGT